jgi:hypothetical protein
MLIRIQLFISMRIHIRIQGAKLMRIHADPDPGQTCETRFEVYLLILVYFHALGSGYGPGFSRIRIQDSQINADPDPQHNFK